MVYTKTKWEITTRISAEALNHLETQYDELKAVEYIWNDHTGRYYTRSQTVTKFFNPSFMGSGSAADADLLDGHHASELMGTGLPIGSILWWPRSSGTVPDGWHICDGGGTDTKLTTDYRDRFIIGASTTYTVKSYHGAYTVTPVSATAVISDYALNAYQIPAHTHTWTEKHQNANVDYNYSSFAGPRNYYYYSKSTTAIVSDPMGGGAVHGHSVAARDISWMSEPNIPPYRALFLIQRLS